MAGAAEAEGAAASPLASARSLLEGLRVRFSSGAMRVGGGGPESAAGTAAAAAGGAEGVGEFVVQVVELFGDARHDVRREAASMVRSIGKKSPNLAAAVADALREMLEQQQHQLLLPDGVAAATVVGRNGLSAAMVLFTSTFESCVRPQQRRRHKAMVAATAWEAVYKLLPLAQDLGTKASSDGVRVHALKLLESVVLLLSGPPSETTSSDVKEDPEDTAMADGDGDEDEDAAAATLLPDATALAAEAGGAFSTLLSLLRAPTVATLPPTVAIAIINSLGLIARRRPSFLARVAPMLLALVPDCGPITGWEGGRGGRAGPVPPTVMASVVHALRSTLLALLKCTFPAAVPWRDRLVSALTEMKAGDAVASALRFLERAARTAEGNKASKTVKQGGKAAVKRQQQQQQDATGPSEAGAARSASATAGKPGAKRLKITSSQQGVAGTGTGPSEPSDAQTRGADEGAAAVQTAAASLPAASAAAGGGGLGGGSGGGERSTAPAPAAAAGQKGPSAATAAAGAAAGGSSGPSRTPEEQNALQQVLTMLSTLVQQGERTAPQVNFLINNLPPETLVDVVIAFMEHLPPQRPEAAPSAPAPAGPGAAGAAVAGSTAAAVDAAGRGGSAVEGTVAASGGAVAAATAGGSAVGQRGGAAERAAGAENRRDPRRDPRRLSDPRRAAAAAKVKAEPPEHKPSEAAAGGGETKQEGQEQTAVAAAQLQQPQHQERKGLDALAISSSPTGFAGAMGPAASTAAAKEAAAAAIAAQAAAEAEAATKSRTSIAVVAVGESRRKVMVVHTDLDLLQPAEGAAAKDAADKQAVNGEVVDAAAAAVAEAAAAKRSEQEQLCREAWEQMAAVAADMTLVGRQDLWVALLSRLVDEDIVRQPKHLEDVLNFLLLQIVASYRESSNSSKGPELALGVLYSLWSSSLLWGSKRKAEEEECDVDRMVVGKEEQGEEESDAVNATGKGGKGKKGGKRRGKKEQSSPEAEAQTDQETIGPAGSTAGGATAAAEAGPMDVDGEGEGGGGSGGGGEAKDAMPSTYKEFLLSLMRRLLKTGGAATTKGSLKTSLLPLLQHAPAVPPSALDLLCRSVGLADCHSKGSEGAGEKSWTEDKDDGEMAVVGEDKEAEEGKLQGEGGDTEGKEGAIGGGAGGVVVDEERVHDVLVVLWRLLLLRPPLRGVCLDAVLQCCIHRKASVRNKAIALVVNKLHPLKFACDRIEQFALQHLTAAAAATSMSAAAAVDAAKSPEAGEGGGEGQGKEGGAEGSEEAEAVRHLALVCALCTKKFSLLPDLFRAFGKCPLPTKTVLVQEMLPMVLNAVPLTAPELTAIVANPPPGSLKLVLKALHCLLDVPRQSGPPPQPLVDAARALALGQSSQDPDLMIPVLPFFSKEEALALLPRLVDFPPDKFKLATDRLLQVQGSALTTTSPLAPAELLIALHGLQPKRDNVPLKKIMAATSFCVGQRAVFDQQVIAKVLNQLVEQTPLPMLLFRTMMETLAGFRDLAPFVVELLTRLTLKQVWRAHPQLWLGFVKCCVHTKPLSFPVLLKLPSAQLDDALMREPTLRPLLTAHAGQPTVKPTLPRATLAVLGLAETEAPASAAPAETPTPMET